MHIFFYVQSCGYGVCTNEDFNGDDATDNDDARRTEHDETLGIYAN